MSQSTNTGVINFCDVCNLSFESKKALYRHQSYNLKHKELLKKMFESEEYEISERVYNLDEDDYIIKTKPATKPKTKTEEDIYTRIKYECKECHEEFRSKVALTTHSYSHKRMYLENTEDFDINSSQNMRDFYITDKGGNYIEDIDEATNYSLEEIKNCYQFRKVKIFKYKITAECDYKKRTKEEVKTTKIFFNTDYINNNAIYEHGDLNRWLDFEKQIYEGYGYDFEFLGIRRIQLFIEPTKASIGSYIDLPQDLKNSKSILNIRSYKWRRVGEELDNDPRNTICEAGSLILEVVTIQEEYINQCNYDFGNEEMGILNRKGGRFLNKLYINNEEFREEIINFVKDKKELDLELILDKRCTTNTLNTLGNKYLTECIASKDNTKDLIEIMANYYPVKD